MTHRTQLILCRREHLLDAAGLERIDAVVRLYRMHKREEARGVSDLGAMPHLLEAIDTLAKKWP